MIAFDINLTRRIEEMSLRSIALGRVGLILGALSLMVLGSSSQKPSSLVETGSVCAFSSPAWRALKLGHGPCGPRLAGIPSYIDRAASDKGQLRKAAWQAQRELLRERTATHLNELATVAIMQGNLEGAAVLLDEAIERLEKNYFSYNNLAVVFLLRYYRDSHPYNLMRALLFVEKALQQKPAGFESLSNRAIILEDFSLKREPEGKNNWHALRNRIGPAEGEKGEVISNVLLVSDHQLIADAVRRSPQTVRIFLEDEMLPYWAHVELQGGRVQAKALLRRAMTLAFYLAKETGDDLLFESLRIFVLTEGRSRRSLLEGLVVYGRARVLFRSRETGGAVKEFLRASILLSREDVPFVEWAEFYSAACSYRDKNYSDAMTRAAALKDRLAGSSYLNLLARTNWLIGLIHLERSTPGQSLGPLQEAEQQFLKTGELGNLAAVLSLTAHALELLGEVREAWNLRHRALSEISDAEDQERLPVILGEAVQAALVEGNYNVALAFQNEATSIDLSSGDSLAIAESLWRRARILEKMQNYSAALQDLSRARASCGRIKHEKTRSQILAGILLTQGSILKYSEPRKAVRYLSQALTAYRNLGFDYLYGEILLERARAYRAVDDGASSAADLEAAISYFDERCRSAGVKEVDCLEKARQALREKMLGLLRSDDFVGALSALERSKARWLYGGIAKGHLLHDKELRHSLPESVVLLQYVIENENSFLWVIAREGIEGFRLTATERSLRPRIDLLVGHLKSGNPYATVMAAGLFDDLVAPAKAALRGCKKIVFIPDGVLHALPFAALIDREGGRYLVEDFEVTSSPSSYSYLMALAQSRSEARRERLTILAIGSPAFDRDTYSSLAKLQVRTELLRLSQFPGSVLLSGPEATLKNFRGEVSRHSIVHFAGHSAISLMSPGVSTLIFAPSESEPGELYARDIPSLPLNRVRLFVLAACGTAIGRFSAEGMESLALPILVAGVPAVLATLWDIEDSASSAFFSIFYMHLARGEDLGEALRNAQLTIMRNGRAQSGLPHIWAGIQLIGAG